MLTSSRCAHSFPSSKIVITSGGCSASTHCLHIYVAVRVAVSQENARVRAVLERICAKGIPHSLWSGDLRAEEFRINFNNIRVF